MTVASFMGEIGVTMPEGVRMAKITPIDTSQAHLYGVSDEAASELVEWRKMVNKPFTQGAFDRAMREAIKCNINLGIPADRAIEIAIDKGWHGVTFEYIKAELERRGEAANRQQVVIHAPEDMQGFVARVTDRGWAH